MCSAETCQSFQIFKLVKPLKKSTKTILILLSEGSLIIICLYYFTCKCLRYMSAYGHNFIKVKNSSVFKKTHLIKIRITKY